MSKITTLLLLTLGIAGLASAAIQPVPEIDPAFGTSAIALLSGAVLVLRSSRKR